MARAVTNDEMADPILSLREAYDAFDQEVQRLMGISGEEFIERWESGELAKVADEPGCRHIMRLALMMPRVDNQSR